jgi:hypothetical protein
MLCNIAYNTYKKGGVIIAPPYEKQGGEYGFLRKKLCLR